jgi:tetratricopeptide (TPR) repeat protein
MEFFDLYGKHVGEFIAWLSKPETNVPAIKLIQAFAALLGATVSVLGFYKAWKFAERRLGRRLDEFLEHEEQRLNGTREIVRAIRQEGSVATSTSPKLFSNSELQLALRLIGKRRMSAAKASLNDTLTQSLQRAELATRKCALHERQRAVAHLLLGALADADSDHQAALIHFQSALEIDGEDLEALEYLGFQYLRLGNAPQALSTFQELEKFAEAKGDALLKAKAAYFCGMAIEAAPNPQLQNANQAYARAIANFPQNGPQLELARIHESRGLVAMRLGFHVLANTQLMHALARYAEYERVHRRGKKPTKQTGTERVIEALHKLQDMINGAPDGTGSSSAADGNAASATVVTLGQQQLPQQPPNSERSN